MGSPCRALAYADAALLAARPIKMGELLRSAYAKQLVNQHKVILRSKVLRMHQWGISLPGACEGLCHLGGTVEPMAANGTLEPLVAADLDLVQC